jgi:hypothetical protein
MTDPTDEQRLEKLQYFVDQLSLQVDTLEQLDEIRETELVSARRHAERTEHRLAEIEKQIQIWRTGSDE